MPSFSKLIQNETRRLARKEVRSDITALQKAGAEFRRAVARLKRRVAVIEAQNKRLLKLLAKRPKPDPAPRKSERARISSKTIRTLRRKLGLTQVEFAGLIGVSGQSVYQWERQGGRLQLRQNTKQAVLAAKSMGKRDAHRRLDALKK